MRKAFKQQLGVPILMNLEFGSRMIEAQPWHVFICPAFRTWYKIGTATATRRRKTVTPTPTVTVTMTVKATTIVMTETTPPTTGCALSELLGLLAGTEYAPIAWLILTSDLEPHPLTPIPKSRATAVALDHLSFAAGGLACPPREAGVGEMI